MADRPLNEYGAPQRPFSAVCREAPSAYAAEEHRRLCRKGVSTSDALEMVRRQIREKRHD